jgi:hypothetical protein
MSLIDFKDRFEEKLHGFLWGQWSQLGVAAAGGGEDRWILDPEALLLLTLESARTEPRLFDEVLDWLLTNGERIDVQRLDNLKNEDNEYPKALLNAVALMLAENETSAKWKRMAGFVPDPAAKKVPLIQLRPGASMPKLGSYDPHFEKAGFLRSPFEARGLSKSAPIQSAPCLRFRLRAFFGIGIRSEAVIYLLTHQESHADDVARAIAYSFPGVQQVLREMSSSGLVHARRAGREKRYWVEKSRWSDFLELRFADPQQLAFRSEAARQPIGAGKELREMGVLELETRQRAAQKGAIGGDESTRLSPFEREARRIAAMPEVAWVNWSRLYRGLARILRFLRRTASKSGSDYALASEFAREVEAAKDDIEASERGFHLPSREGASFEMYLKGLQRSVEGLLS